MLDQDQMAGMVSNLRKATERMEELIGAMLDVSQLDVNAMDLRFAQTSLESVMRMAIEPLTDAVKQRKLTLSARGLRGLPVIQADMQRLVQAFRNVVVNAIKFTPDGGRIEIKASLQPAENPGQQDHLLITVSDTGVGIDKENLELIFRKFYRAYDPEPAFDRDVQVHGRGSRSRLDDCAGRDRGARRENLGGKPRSQHGDLSRHDLLHPAADHAAGRCAARAALPDTPETRLERADAGALTRRHRLNSERISGGVITASSVT